MKSKLSRLQIYPLDHSELGWAEKLALKSSFTFGICPVCGNLTIFTHFSENLRESGLCKICQSNNRKRQMAFVLLEAIYEATGIKFTSIREFTAKASQSDKFSDFKIYNTETTGSIHNYLKDLTGYIASEYLGYEYKSGEVINGLLHQNLMETSLEDSSLDLVMSGDVFEHIPDPYKAFAEVYRILKPGGRHIFTVPFYSDRYRDEVRATLSEDGTVNHLLPPIYHGDPIRSEGILVYVIFSMEMLCKLSDIGYQVRMYNVRNHLKGILGSNSLVFDSIKNK